jgi:hypothetical protein
MDGLKNCKKVTLYSFYRPFKYICTLVSKLIGLMQVLIQFPGISVTVLEVLYVVYIIITRGHQKF